jgi:hypothetical protein
MFGNKTKTPPMSEAEQFLAMRAAVVPPLSMPAVEEIATLCSGRPVEEVLAEVRQAVKEELERRAQVQANAAAEQCEFLAALRARDEKRQRDEEAEAEWRKTQRPPIWVDVKVPDPDARSRRG